MLYRFLLISMLVFSFTAQASEYQKLKDLFHEWRQFEIPPQFYGVPDYRAETFKKRDRRFTQLRI